jgi:ubiquinol-cytochrome c reductase cytochrome b subunit
MLRRFSEWLDDRTGIPSAIRRFLDEEIPASAGWHQVFGSVALFAFLIQLATGLLLALNYGATPSEAHASIRYIMTELAGGAVIRGLHHWGSSAMIVVVALHLIQTFLWGAYKKPREATWIVGCVLLLLTLAFGLTGYLLPWDNKAYWGTVVTTQVAGLAPVAGPYVMRLLGADASGIGVVTFSRFYTAHVILLPLVTLALIGLHVYLVRRHGVTPAPGDEHRPKKRFYPVQAFKDTVAASIYVATLAILANFARVGLGAIADPTDSTYVPRPEWYFLFLFEILKAFEGPLEVVGAIVLPTLAVAALALAPFLDRSRVQRVQQRTFAMTLAALCVLGWAGLTQRAIATTPPSSEDPTAGLKPPAIWREIPAEHLAAIGYFRRSNCVQCHDLGRSSPGPDLAKAPSFRPPEWLTAHFAMPDPAAPPNRLNGPQLKALVTLVTRRDEKGLYAWATAPQEAVDGAILYHSKNCGFCHTLNGEGGTLAPRMNGLSSRRSRAWVEEHFGDPKKLVPASNMPAFKLPPQELAILTDYIMAIPK